MRNDFRQIKKEYSNRWVFERLQIPHSGFRIPDSLRSTNPSKTWRTVNKFTFTALSPFFVGLKPYSHGKQWLTVCNLWEWTIFEWHILDFSLSILTILLDIRDGETLAKWRSRASSTTHPSTETEWPPKLLTRISNWRMELHSDMQENQ